MCTTSVYVERKCFLTLSSHDGLSILSQYFRCFVGNQSVTIDAPESGRANQGQGNNTSSGREDYIDQSRQGAK